MRIKQTPEQLKDFGLYGLKSLQDIALVAYQKKDFENFKTVISQLCDSFKNYLGNPHFDNIDMLRFRLENSTDIKKEELQKRYDDVLIRKDVADSLGLAIDQIIFGISAWILEKFVSNPHRDEVDSNFVHEMFDHIPESLGRFTKVFYTVKDMKTSDFWGWQWLDFRSDGEAHMIDTQSRPNRLFVVGMLKMLMRVSRGRDIRLPIDQDSDYLFGPEQPNGLPSMVKSVVDARENYKGILSDDELSMAPLLLELISKANDEIKASRDAKLIESKLDTERLTEFRNNVVEAHKSNGRFRKLMQKLGCYIDQTKDTGPTNLRLWGYNQIDEKGAFIADWHVSYSRWGESYGMGLAQAEDQNAYSQMVSAAEKLSTIPKYELIAKIDEALRTYPIKDPIVFQSLTTSLEYEEIRQKQLFISSSHRDCPVTSVSGADGFIGVLKVADSIVPVIDVFVQDQKLRNKILIANVSKFMRWEQFCPLDKDNKGDVNDITENILIKVIDLNADESRRNTILESNPPWLQKESDKNKFLRSHVVVNVYEKYRIKFLNRKSALCLSVD